MTNPEPSPLLTSAVTNLKKAYRDLKDLTEPLPKDGARTNTPPPHGAVTDTPPPPPQVNEDDRMQLTDFADEVDDILRRVAALKSRLEPV